MSRNKSGVKKLSQVNFRIRIADNQIRDMIAVSIIYVGSIIYYTLVGPTVTGPVLINVYHN